MARWGSRSHGWCDGHPLSGGAPGRACLALSQHLCGPVGLAGRKPVQARRRRPPQQGRNCTGRTPLTCSCTLASCVLVNLTPRSLCRHPSASRWVWSVLSLRPSWHPPPRTPLQWTRGCSKHSALLAQTPPGPRPFPIPRRQLQCSLHTLALLVSFPLHCTEHLCTAQLRASPHRSSLPTQGNMSDFRNIKLLLWRQCLSKRRAPLSVCCEVSFTPPPPRHPTAAPTAYMPRHRSSCPSSSRELWWASSPSSP